MLLKALTVLHAYLLKEDKIVYFLIPLSYATQNTRPMQNKDPSKMT